MQTGDFWTKGDVFPKSGVIGYHAPFSAYASHATYLFVGEVTEDMQKDFVWEFFNSLQKIKNTINLVFYN